MLPRVSQARIIRAPICRLEWFLLPAAPSAPFPRRAVSPAASSVCALSHFHTATPRHAGSAHAAAHDVGIEEELVMMPVTPARKKRTPKAASTASASLPKPRAKRVLKNTIPLPSLEPLRKPQESNALDSELAAEGEERAAPTTALMSEVSNLQLKHPEHVLLVQVGGFYEIYDFGHPLDDLAALLHLKIARPGAANRCCGFPLSKVKGYVELLQKNGMTVAVADQTDRDLTSKTKNHLRTVTRIFTPGTVLEEEWIEETENNFLLCIAPGAEGSRGRTASSSLALAWLDVSTGEFLVCDAPLNTFEEHLGRIQPREILCDQVLVGLQPDLVGSLSSRRHEFHLTVRPASHEAAALFAGHVVANDAKAVFGNHRSVLDKFSDAQMRAAGNLLAYVQATFCVGDPIFAMPAPFHPEQVVRIDSVTQGALEITRTFREHRRKGSLLCELDRTKTAVGGRLLANRLKAPAISVPEINRRLDLVEAFFDDTHFLSDVRHRLSDVRDVERAIQKIHVGKCGLGDYIGIIMTLRLACQLGEMLDAKSRALEACGSTTLAAAMGDLRDRLQVARVLLEACDGYFRDDGQDMQAITEVAAVREGVSTKLDAKRAELETLMAKKAEMERALCSQYGVPVAETCEAVSDRNLGAFIAIAKLSKPSRAALRARIEKDPNAQLLERTKSTATIVKFMHADWGLLAPEIETCKEDIAAAQREIFRIACDKVKEHTAKFVTTCRAIAETDVSVAAAYYARNFGCVRPVITEELVHDVKGGRHPVVERAQMDRESQFVENSYRIGHDQRMWLLTGPNMGGKSTFLRQSALMSIIAQTGLYVPATSAILGVVDKIFARVGASDDLAMHKSTFLVEMEETAAILNNATKKSFVIMDEIGRGTSTLDGHALARAVLTHLHSTNACRGVFATHYHELATRVRNDGDLPAVGCFRTAIIAPPEGSEGSIKYTYRVEKGIMDRSHGIECARDAGLPMPVIRLAKQFYSLLEEEESFKRATIAAKGSRQ
ncbi:hypothetical protein HDU86_004039 [Geranomyces michiganensis]|nr:hypothetical protein HDU86_004039 [Geranomyces michiganensis]